MQEIRKSLNLEPHTSFDDFAPPFGDILSSVYESVDDIDCFPGMLSERHPDGSMLGDSMMAVLSRQFQNIRDGDRFFYKNILSGE